MSTEARESAAQPGDLIHGEQRLSKRLGFLSALIIGLASTAPAYSFAAVIGLIAAASGFQSPAVVLVAFVPMLLVATAYYSMNRIDPDPGTTFAWATRALGPVTGWLAGWAIFTAGVIVIGLLAQTAAVYGYYLAGADGLADDKAAQMIGAVVIMGVMSAITIIGIGASARTQNALIVFQLGGLLLFGIVMLVKVLAGDGPEGSVTPELSWINPLAIDSQSVLIAGVLVTLFAYWGWDSSVTVNEESEDSTGAPGKAAVIATILLVGLYLLLMIAGLAWLGAEGLGRFEDETAFNEIAEQVLGSPLDKVVIFAVFTSALAGTQTTVLPASRTALSMGRHRAAPGAMASVHPRYLTPVTATLTVAGAAIGFYVLIRLFSEDFYAAAIGALGLLICINYGLNGLACAVFYRRAARSSASRFLVLFLAPLVGAVIFGYVFARSVYDLTKGGLEDTTYWLGLQAPLVLTAGLFVVAALLMLAVRGGFGAGFFARRRETFESHTVPPPPTTVTGSRTGAAG